MWHEKLNLSKILKANQLEFVKHVPHLKGVVFTSAMLLCFGVLTHNFLLVECPETQKKVTC